MNIMDKNIDGGKAFDWGKPQQTMQSIAIFIRRNFTIKF